MSESSPSGGKPGYDEAGSAAGPGGLPEVTGYPEPVGVPMAPYYSDPRDFHRPSPPVPPPGSAAPAGSAMPSDAVAAPGFVPPSGPVPSRPPAPPGPGGPPVAAAPPPLAVPGPVPPHGHGMPGNPAAVQGDPRPGEVRRYLDAVAQGMAGARLGVSRGQIGPVRALIGVGMAVETSLNPIELAVCVAELAEITPAAVTDFPARVNEFAHSLRRRSAVVVKGGAFGVAALVSHRVHPAAIAALKNRSMSYGSVIVPAVVDLGQRRVHIASNTPIIGLAVWGTVRGYARAHLPDPRLVLG